MSAENTQKSDENKTLKKLFIGLAWIMPIILLVVLISGVRSCKSSKKADTDNQTQNTTVNTTAKEPLIIFDGYTPCDPIIDCKFSLETYGKPVYEKFTGSSKVFYFDGVNDPGVPSDAKGGPVHITSASNEQVRVVIKQVP
jgi:hypothetical protein